MLNNLQSCLRVTDTSRMTYTLTGLAIRLARSMDLHLDNARLSTSPFEGEMRKRLWWTLCSLECRSAEEYGFHPSVGGQTPDCALPLNVNDEDLDPDATEPPEARSGCTSMTCELPSSSRRISVFLSVEIPMACLLIPKSCRLSEYLSLLLQNIH